jgi:hypothetical protein
MKDKGLIEKVANMVIKQFGIWRAIGYKQVERDGVVYTEITEIDDVNNCERKTLEFNYRKEPK